MKACFEAFEKQEKHYNVCPAAYLRTLVTPKGFRLPLLASKQEFKLGDITNNFFSEIWQGKMRKKVMKKLNPRWIVSFIAFHDSNVSVLKLKENWMMEKTLTLFLITIVLSNFENSCSQLLPFRGRYYHNFERYGTYSFFGWQ